MPPFAAINKLHSFLLCELYFAQRRHILQSFLLFTYIESSICTPWRYPITSDDVREFKNYNQNCNIAVSAGGGDCPGGGGGACPLGGRWGCLPLGGEVGCLPGGCLPRVVSAQGVHAQGGCMPACNGLDSPLWTDRHV